MKASRLLAGVGVGLVTLLGVTWRLASFHGRGQCSVQGAGTAEANGFYLGLEGGSSYGKAAALGSSSHQGLVPDVFESWGLLRKLQWSPWAITYDDAEASWMLGQPPSQLYYVAPNFFKGAVASRQPPANLWQARRGSPPPPTLTHILPLPPKEASDSYKRLNEQVRLMYERPGTALLIAINLAVAYRLWAGRVPVDQVSFSLHAVLEDHEYWRMVTASFSHLDLLHLAFNMLSLYNLSSLETLLGGALPYLTLSLALVVLTMLCNTLAYWLLSVVCRRGEAAARQQSVGYSCVIFAWVVAASVISREYCPMPGLPKLCFSTYTLPGLHLPVNLAPFFLLVLTQFIMPRASFIGHLSGILLGYPLAWHWLDALSPPLLSLLVLALILLHERAVLLCPPPPTSSSASGVPAAPSSPALLPTALLLATHLALAITSLTCLSPSSSVPHLLLPLLTLLALRSSPPSLRLTSLVLLLLVLPLLLTDLLTLATTLARRPLYHQVLPGLAPRLTTRALTVLGLQVAVGLALLYLLLTVVQSTREGYTALQAAGIELLPPSSPDSRTTQPFGGHGRALGGGSSNNNSAATSSSSIAVVIGGAPPLQRGSSSSSPSSSAASSKSTSSTSQHNKKKKSMSSSSHNINNDHNNGHLNSNRGAPAPPPNNMLHMSSNNNNRRQQVSPPPPSIVL